MQHHNISVEKSYHFGNDIKEIAYKNKFLVVDPQEAKWIILTNYSQIKIFRFLQAGYSVKDILQNKEFDRKDIQYVLTQIEARKFGYNSSHYSEKGEELHIYLTNACNLRCPHCYMFSDTELQDELTTDEIKGILKWFSSITKCGVVTFSGGEPSLRKDLVDLVYFGHSCGLEIKLMTNGTKFPLTLIDRVYPYLSSVQVSIDGFSESSNSIIRGNGNFQKALHTVDAFLSRGVQTIISMTPAYTILKNNLEGFIEFAKDIVKEYDEYPFELRFSDELLNGRNISNAEEINEEYRKYIEAIQKSIYGDDFRVIEFVRTLMDVTILTNCAFGNLAIACNGDAYLCPRIQALTPLGNIREHSIEELYKKALVARAKTSVFEIEPCCDCEIRYICGGGCRIDELAKFIEGNNFLKLDEKKKIKRHCSLGIKERMYDLMIGSNEYFYS